MRTRKRSKDQLRAIHASYANGYKRKGHRKKQKVVLKPRRVVKHTKITKISVPKKEKTSKELKKKALHELGEDELWQIKQGNYYNRVVDNLNTAFIPSRESFDRLESIGLFDSEKAQQNYFAYVGDPEGLEEWEYEDYFDTIKEKAAKDDKEVQKDLINSLDNYQAEYDSELQSIVAVGIKNSVNANGTGGEPATQYTIYFEGTDYGENAFQDGILVRPKEIVAIYDGKAKRYLTTDELSNIKFSNKGEQPSIKQLEKNN